MSQIRELREKLVKAVEATTGFTLKRASYGTTTGGLSVSNKEPVANGFAHLLCNNKNFAAVQVMLDKWDEIKDGEFIPAEHGMFDVASVLYACGTAPRVVPGTKRHVSKDAALTGGINSQKFIAWAQAWRIQLTGTGYVGLSRSVKASYVSEPAKPMKDVYVNGFNISNFLRVATLTAEMLPQSVDEKATEKLNEVKQSQEHQRSMLEMLTSGNKIALGRILQGKSLTDINKELENRLAATEARKAAKTKVQTDAAPTVKKSGEKRGNKKQQVA